MFEMIGMGEDGARASKKKQDLVLFSAILLYFFRRTRLHRKETKPTPGDAVNLARAEADGTSLIRAAMRHLLGVWRASMSPSQVFFFLFF